MSNTGIYKPRKKGIKSTSDLFVNNQQTKYEEISLEDIRPNKLNNLPITNVEELAEVLEKDGQTVPLVVYRHDATYVLIAGERRWNALKLTDITTAHCIVVERPKDEVEERLMIESANAQREETQELVKLRVDNFEKIYDLLKEEKKIETGVLKRDWIGLRMNMSGRNIQRYLSQTQHGHDGHVDKKSSTQTEISQVVKVAKSLLRKLENIDYSDPLINHSELSNLFGSLKELDYEVGISIKQIEAQLKK